MHCTHAHNTDSYTAAKWFHPGACIWAHYDTKLKK